MYDEEMERLKRLWFNIYKVRCPYCRNGLVEDVMFNIGEVTTHELCNGAGVILYTDMTKYERYLTGKNRDYPDYFE